MVDDCNPLSSARTKFYYEEKNRLSSFHNWQFEHVVKKADLAKAGFYIDNQDLVFYSDQCKCAFCALVLSQWEYGDRPQVEHSKNSPYCRMTYDKTYARGYNVPLEQEYRIEWLHDIRRKNQPGRTLVCDSDIPLIDTDRLVRVELTAEDASQQKTLSYADWQRSRKLDVKDL